MAYWIHKETKQPFSVGIEPGPDEVSEMAETRESQLDLESGDEPLTLLESGTAERTVAIQTEEEENIS